jgi:hypothetical protein
MLKHYQVSQLDYETWEEYQRTYLLEYGDFIERQFSTNIGDFSITIPEYADSWYAKEHEPKLGFELSNTLSSNAVFYDVGVQFGYFIEFALQAGVDPSNIHGFEQKSNNWAHLQSEYSSTKVELNNSRVSDKNGDDTVTIDSYTSQAPSPDVIKIDVEGAEGNVLDGAEETLDSETPIVYIEIHPLELPDFGYSVEKIYNILREYGYTIQLCDHRDKTSSWVSIGEESKVESGKGRTYLLRATI